MFRALLAQVQEAQYYRRLVRACVLYQLAAADTTRTQYMYQVPLVIAS
jgi:hypothetical protein